ncbi:MAG: TetR/AcrR family transcriptional regulator [Myxococcota bacterium]
MSADSTPKQSRSEQTRAKLMDATIESLAECGYAGTSTQEVCRRAGVSRGTMLHHFPNRNALLLAALDSILAERVARFVASRQGQSPLQPTALVQQLWAEWQGPVYVAWLELAVAARTDPQLREPMRALMTRFDNEVRSAFMALVDLRHVPPALAEVLPSLVFSIFNGLAVGASYERPGQSDPVIALVEQLGRILPALGGSS